mgnify:CR=1 FL=1
MAVWQACDGIRGLCRKDHNFALSLHEIMAMGSPYTSLGVLIACPAANVLRIAALAALPDGALDEETLATLAGEVDRGVLDDYHPLDAWPELALGLMGEAPSRMLWALRRSGALARLLPEIDALFGMPQADNLGEVVDIGTHVFRVADVLAAERATLRVRSAALFYNLGKSDSPPQHLPSHYRHVDRGLPRVAAVCQRFGLPEDFSDLALLATAELERVHRAAEMRAGSIAALLERVDAFGQPARFEELMQLCAADYRAFPGASAVYPKRRLLETALAACAASDGEMAVQPQADDEGLREARTLAVARALRSMRWSAAESSGD